jgi:hypothetical protein
MQTRKELFKAEWPGLTILEFEPEFSKCLVLEREHYD